MPPSLPGRSLFSRKGLRTSGGRRSVYGQAAAGSLRVRSVPVRLGGIVTETEIGEKQSSVKIKITPYVIESRISDFVPSLALVIVKPPRHPIAVVEL